jgi:uncharacterized protein (DUF305 family)
MSKEARPVISTKRNLVLAGAGLAAVLTLAACGSGSDEAGGSMGSMGGHGSSTSMASSDDKRAGDVMFAQMMIPHHEQAIEMADLALQNPTAGTEVRALAQQIKGAQDPEIQTMHRWMREWGASASAPMDHGSGGMMSAQDMTALGQAKGSAFDRMWLTMMIEHHEGAVTMAQDVLSTTANAEVEALARDIVDGQKKEISTMQGLLG